MDEQTEVLATRENEWDTDEVLRIGEDYYYRRINGGACGSRNRQRGNGSWDGSALECREISQSEARRLLLEFNSMGLEAIYAATA